MLAAKKLICTRREDTFISTGFTNWKNARTRLRGHECGDCHKDAIEIFVRSKQATDISKAFSMQLTQEKELNRQMFIKILHSIRYLTRQGIAMRGHDEGNGNFIQSLKLQGRTDPRLNDWLDKKAFKYVSHDIQNECIQIMALSVLRQISRSLSNGVHFCIMADEVTDSSNREPCAKLNFYWTHLTRQVKYRNF